MEVVLMVVIYAGGGVIRIWISSPGCSDYFYLFIANYIISQLDPYYIVVGVEVVLGSYTAGA